MKCLAIFIFNLFSGNLISSQGPGTAAEFSFAILEHFLGAERAEEVAKFYLYNTDVLPKPAN